jgi:hypothetical protein
VTAHQPSPAARKFAIRGRPNRFRNVGRPASAAQAAAMLAGGVGLVARRFDRAAEARRWASAVASAAEAEVQVGLVEVAGDWLAWGAVQPVADPQRLAALLAVPS